MPRFGNIPPNKGKSLGLAWLREHAQFTGHDCLLWPFGKARGYGQVTAGNGDKRILKAHRVMCGMAHGEPPTPKHEAAHSCGNHGCVNPNHLSWKTRAENQAESVAMGRKYTGGRAGPLGAYNARTILGLKGKLSQDRIAEMFRVSHSTVAKIHRGELWKSLS